jgi:hypothetical protein
MTDVIIGYDRLTVVLAYLADKAPEDVRQRREWARCISILSAQRKTAPGATETHTHTCWTCTLRMGCAATPNAGCGGYTTDAAKMTSPDDDAGKCGGCELRGNCDEDTMPGGCPKYVAKEWKGVKAHSILLCVDCVKKGLCTINRGPFACDLYVPDAAQTLTTNATLPPQYDPATVAFPAYVTRETHERELNEVTDSLSARMDALSVQLAELDKDHVDLVKCYVHHLREHMPEALRNAGEVPSITREELAGVDELRAEVVALAGEVTAQPGYFDAAIAKAIAAHEIAAAEHFQGQIDTLSRVVDEDRKAVVTHERELHNPTGKGEPFPCPTCLHHAVCRKTVTENTCESWEGQHPK